MESILILYILKDKYLRVGGAKQGGGGGLGVATPLEFWREGFNPP